MRQYQSENKSLSHLPLNLKALRGGLSQSEFAQFLGIPNQVTYQRYEAGRVPRPLILQQITDRLGITIDELLKPIPPLTAFGITARAMVAGAISRPSAQIPSRVRETTIQSFSAATGELVTPKNIRMITKALCLETISDDDLTSFFEHIVSVSNRAPGQLMKYYVLIRRAVVEELAKRMKLK